MVLLDTRMPMMNGIHFVAATGQILMAAYRQPPATGRAQIWAPRLGVDRRAKWRDDAPNFSDMRNGKRQ